MSASNSNGWTEERLEKFWRAMASLYGRRWYAEQGNAIDAVWRAELSQLEPEVVAHGWQACMDSGEAHPPSLPVFLARAKAARSRFVALGPKDDARITAMHEAAARQAAYELPAPDKVLMKRLKAAPDVRKAALDAMRGKLPKRKEASLDTGPDFDYQPETEPEEIFNAELEEWKQGKRPKTWQAEK